MLSIDELESGSRVTHKNTGLQYSIVDLGDGEVLLHSESEGLQDLVVPTSLFVHEFVAGDRYSPSRGRTRARSRSRRGGVARVASGPRAKGKIKKMVRERGFGFIRGDDGKEVFFHRSGLNSADYDALSEGDAVEYVVSEGPRGPRAENVRAVSDSAAAAAT